MNEEEKEPIDKKEVENLKREIDKRAMNLSKERKKPLLILYYHSNEGKIEHRDMEDLYGELRRRLKGEVEDIDVVLHTMGGAVNPSYRIIQVIRDFSKKINIIIPYYAYSGGTLMSLGADKIYFGSHAVISPIDIQAEEIETGKLTSLIGVDNYVDFVNFCTKRILETLKKLSVQHREKYESDIACGLLVELVKQMGWEDLSKFFRERELTARYAKTLLLNYMFKGIPDSNLKVNKIIDEILFKSPAHEFEMDYKIATEIGLPINKLPTKLSDKYRELIDLLKKATSLKVICPYIGKGYRYPFFRLYGVK